MRHKLNGFPDSTRPSAVALRTPRPGLTRGDGKSGGGQEDGSPIEKGYVLM